jgi:hypothetical protein
MLAAYALGFSCMPLEPEVVLGHDVEHCLTLKHSLYDFIDHEQGVLILDKHAVAFSYGCIYDPKGKIYRLTNQEYRIVIPVFDLIK